MRSLVFVLFLSGWIGGGAHADESEPENPPPSLWDVVEEGIVGPVSAEEEAASQELQAERVAEQAYLDGEERVGEPDSVILSDPESLLDAEEASGLELDPSRYDIPVVHNEIVEKWMDFWQGRGRGWFTTYLERKAAWEPMIHAVMDEAGLPKDLIFVSMIESGFSNHAHSHASAVGMWQFIAPVARGYGLRVDYWVDERKDPVLATHAAKRFYTDLHRQFEDWWLAMAAYNTGPGRVRRAIRKHGSRDYWHLVDQRALPPETRDYVGKVVAAAILSKDPEGYGFEVTDPRSPWQFEEVEIEGSVSVEVIARCSGHDEDAIDALNPKLLRGATPPNATTVIRLPAGSKEAFEVAYAALPEDERLSYARHTVARGEALGVIAERYGVPMQSIVEFNRLPNANRIRVGMELVIPVPVGEAPVVSAPNSRSGGNRPVTIRVQSGDNLSTLAQTHGVTRKEIMEWNGISDPNRIQIGQELRLFAGEVAAKRGPYTVKPGDSLYSIARAHDLTVEDLKRFNSLRSNTIQPGQTLRLGAE